MLSVYVGKSRDLSSWPNYIIFNHNAPKVTAWWGKAWEIYICSPGSGGPPFQPHASG